MFWELAPGCDRETCHYTMSQSHGRMETEEVQDGKGLEREERGERERRRGGKKGRRRKGGQTDSALTAADPPLRPVASSSTSFSF